MGIFTKEKFDKGEQTRLTPMNIFEPLNQEFDFEYDLACNEHNRLCQKGFSESDDALNQSWKGKTSWLNPPFGQVGKWVKKAWEESQNDNTTIVMLLFSKTNTVWWHKYIMNSKEVRYVKGRPKFIGMKHGLPFPLSIVVFSKSDNPTIYKSFTLKGDEK